MIKITLALLVAVLAAVLAARLTYDATAYTGASPVNQPWSQNSIKFVTWNGEKWAAWVRDDSFELRPLNEGRWSPHAKNSLAFIDWEGEPWQAKIEGDTLLLAYRGDWKSSPERVTAIRYRDWQGEDQLRTLTQLRR